jgi:peptidyl-tRNA hydrolase
MKLKEEFPIEYTLYILMRNDLDSMNNGRAAAQASHASNAFIHKYGDRTDVQRWQNQTVQGFGSVVVLSIDELQLENVFTEAKRLKLPHDAVVDPDYGVKTTWELFKLLDTKKYTRYFSADTSNESAVMFFRSEITCAYIFGVKEELTSILGHLKLYN